MKARSTLLLSSMSSRSGSISPPGLILSSEPCTHSLPEFECGSASACPLRPGTRDFVRTRIERKPSSIASLAVSCGDFRFPFVAGGAQHEHRVLTALQQVARQRAPEERHRLAQVAPHRDRLCGGSRRRFLAFASAGVRRPVAGGGAAGQHAHYRAPLNASPRAGARRLRLSAAVEPKEASTRSPVAPSMWSGR